MNKPNFLYVGAPKAGSTWLYYALEQHPEVFVPTGKYVHYFTNFFDRGERWYLKHFQEALPEVVAVGEFTTDYMFFEDAVRRIKDFNPDMKLLVSVRDPLERDESAYRFLKRNGQAKNSLLEEMESGHHFLTKCGQYKIGLMNLLRHFPEQQVKVILFDDIKSKPEAVLRDICEFLDIQSDFNFTLTKGAKYSASKPRVYWLAWSIKRLSILARRMDLTSLIGKVKRNKLLMKLVYQPIDKSAEQGLSQHEISVLVERYKMDVEYLEVLLSRDLSHWMQR